MIVAKFGGSSLVGAAEYLRVADIIRQNNIPVVIVSAPGGDPKVTDLLIAAYREWERCGKCDKTFAVVAERFDRIASPLGIKAEAKLSAVREDINAGCGFDYAVSRGEYIGAYLLAELLGYEFADAKEYVKLTLDGKIDFDSVKAHVKSMGMPCVIPGFYGKMPNGKVKLLPRGGSDISAAAIASALDAEYRKWTNVDGVFDGHGSVIETMSYDEAELLCSFGATVLQSEAVPLIKRTGVKLTIGNTFSSARGTVISDEATDGYALSRAQMFLGGDEAAAHADEIINEGLKIRASATVLGKTQILIDGCGFSPLALKRILHYSDIRPVSVTAVIGKTPSLDGEGDLFWRGSVGSLYIKSNQSVGR